MCSIMSLFSNSLAMHLTVVVLKLIITYIEWMKYEDFHTQIAITHATATKNASKSTVICQGKCRDCRHYGKLPALSFSVVIYFLDSSFCFPLICYLKNIVIHSMAHPGFLFICCLK